MNEQLDSNKRYYSNSIGIEVTNIDVKLRADYRNKDGIEPLCEIILSPEQAKLTMYMLEQAIAGFEQNHRKIDININGVSKTEGKE